MADLLGLRHVIFDVRGEALESSGRGRTRCLSLDLHPDFSMMQQRRLMPTPPTEEPQRVLPSKLPDISLGSGAAEKQTSLTLAESSA
jgi:hypothetical protein